MSQLWSWALAAVGILGIYLAGRKRAAGWLVGVGAQALWMAYAIATRQWGFVVTAVAYAAIYGKNWLAWRNEAAEPYDSWPTCPDCLVRFPTRGQLAEHRRAHRGDA